MKYQKIFVNIFIQIFDHLPKMNLDVYLDKKTDIQQNLLEYIDDDLHSEDKFQNINDRRT